MSELRDEPFWSAQALLVPGSRASGLQTGRFEMHEVVGMPGCLCLEGKGRTPETSHRHRVYHCILGHHICLDAEAVTCLMRGLGNAPITRPGSYTTSRVDNGELPVMGTIITCNMGLNCVRR